MRTCPSKARTNMVAGPGPPTCLGMRNTQEYSNFVTATDAASSSVASTHFDDVWELLPGTVCGGWLGLVVMT